MEEIYRTYNDTEVTSIVINVECPYCGNEWQEDEIGCGESKEIKCENEWLDSGCGKTFLMHFDAS